MAPAPDDDHSTDTGHGSDADQLPDDVHRAIVDQVCEALVFADRDGVIRLWNAAAEALFGVPAAQAIGSSLDIIIPERFRAAHWKGYHAAIANGQTRHGAQVRTTRALHPDGGRLYVDMSFGLVCAGDGTPIGSIAMARKARPDASASATQAGASAPTAGASAQTAGASAQTAPSTATPSSPSTPPA